MSRPLAAAMVITILASAVFAGARPPGDAGRGKAIFQSRCIACHKTDGTGGVHLTGNPSPNWKDPKHVGQPAWTDSFLRDCIQNGKARSGMPAWGRTGQLKPAEIEDLIAHIHALAAPPGRNAR